MDEFPMHQAAQEGDLAMVRYLIEMGLSVDSRDDWERTPLHIASREGRHAVVKLLISSMCDLDPEDFSGSTPVLVAAIYEKETVVDLLLQHGAQVDCADGNNWTLLHEASRRGWTNIVRLIVDSGEADLNAVMGHGGATPLMIALLWRHVDVAVLLIRAGADVNRSYVQKRTALHLAARGGHTRVVQELMEREGLDLNPQDDDGKTPLHLACYKRQRGVMMQLLEAGADATLKSNDGETALSGGIIQWSFLTLEEIRLFVQNGAFLQECDYVAIFEDQVLKESVLNDVDLCTQSIVNKFHHQSLPALKGISYFARQLPNIDKFKLKARQVDEVENLVRCEIERNNFCSVVKVHPMALSALCVLSLITCESGTKISASPDLGDSN